MNKLAPPLDPPEVHSVGHSDLSPPYLHASTFSAGTTVYHHTTGSTQREPPSSFDRSSSKLQPDVSMPAEVSSTQRPPSSQELPVSNDVPANNKKEKQVDDIFLPAAAAAAAAGITTMAPPPLGDEWRGTSASLSRRSMGSSSSSRIPRHVTDETAFGSSYRGSRRVSDTRRLSQREDFPDSRCIYINNPDRTNENYTMAGNKVRTSKYTLISFVPRNLFEQFHRYAYIYFLLLVILNQIPQLAVFGRFASLIPLILVLVVTAIKDGFEDWGRHRSDRRENNRVALVLNHDGQYTYKKWKHIRVGEMVKVHANETVPCDMVLLGTSDPSGVAYVETLNLDGESNLKSRYARQETSNQHPEVGPLTGLIVCKAPDRNIYDFSAFMELPADSQDIRIPLGQNNIILRGCEVKNTSWVVGVVVYAGRETKAMLNSSGAQSKRSKLEHYMNRETGWLVVFLVVICFVGGLGMGLWVATNYDYLNIILYYKKMDSNGGNYLFSGSVGEGIFGFLSCVIRFQVMIPLSLYISLELVRLGQSYFMIRDTEMYDAGSNSKFQCRALNINEDLGQIKYLFSDKTGTLTENKMEFHTASIDGVDYSNAKVIIEPATGKIEGSITPEDSHFVEEILTKQAWKPKVGAKVDPDLVHLLTGRPSTAPRRDALFDYMLVLVACNTIVPTRVKKTASGQLEMEAVNSMEDGSGFIEYQGESPDEQALVAAAAAYGFTLLERTSANIVVNVLGEVQRYEVLGIHEFDSVRKCMSVVVECPDGTIKLLVKGADSTVLSLIGPGDDENAAERRESAEQLQWQAEVREQTLEHLDKYAREGLRTLVIASRVLTQKEVEDWHFHYAKASTALHDRVGMLRNAAGLVENNLVLLGASGIEDRLQDGVPETIALLREAGIKVWVLTGDKQETAISIGFSCLLLTQDMQQIIINESTIESCRAAIADAKRKYGILPTQKKRKWFSIKHQNSVEASIPTLNDSHYENSAEDHEEEMERVHRSLALIIDGNSLVHALSKELEQDLFELATACRVVICCRVAPLQKAGIVSLVKRRAREMTLAVGDGANDVSMIQMADVGVGISGQEGRQAVMASDFALGQFRFLKRLLLVHGHWNYQRLAYMVLYNFYRNAVFVMMLFWFILYSAFSPSSALTDWNLIFFSLLYTSVPTIVVGILDKDLSHKTLLQYPQLYAVGQRGETYNQRLFWVTMIDTLWQSLVLFYVPYFVYRGSEVDLYSLGFLFCMAVVIVVNIHLAMDINRWTWIEHAAIWISTLATFICQLVMDALTIADLLPNHWVSFHMCGELRFWFALLLTVILSLLPRFCIKILKQRIWPSDVHIAREAEILGRIRHQSQPSLELHELPPSMANSSPPSAAVSV